MPNDQVEEFDKDFTSPIIDLSSASPHSPEDAHFTYCFDDINRLSRMLGIPWELAKDILFSTRAPFIGFLWDLETLQVSIPEQKKEKYLEAIREWEKQPAHTLLETQQLHGKLLHASSILPARRAYLVSLKAMLSICNNCPHMPHTPPKKTLQTTSIGGKGTSLNPMSPTPSQDLLMSSTPWLTQTLAQVLALRSGSMVGGELGAFTRVEPKQPQHQLG